MPIDPYKYSGPIDTTVSPDLSTLRDKSVIVTGGANGLGEAYVRAFSAAGAYVTFGDTNEQKGLSIEKELAPNVQFVKCDTRDWDQQVNLFKKAKASSPAKSCDVVIANAGVSGPDEIFASSGLEDATEDPTKPDLRILNINLTGVLYTTKIAMNYFRLQPEAPGRDRCFIFKGSIAGLIDQPGSWQYSASKFALRGLMRSMRHTTWQSGIRVNYVGPFYTKTDIISQAVIDRLEAKGVKFSLKEDCAAAMLKIATDKTINGHSLAIVPREDHKQGFIDAELDDMEDGTYWDELQKATLAASIRSSVPASKQ